MRLKCIHGYFMFSETNMGQVADFMAYTGFTLVPVGDYYTFEELADAPRYSLAGKTLIDLPAIATFEGNPWEVFEANGFVFDFVTGLVRPIASIVQTVQISDAGNRYVSPGLILPGSVCPSGIVTGYDGWFSRDRLSWLYSEVSFV